MKKCGAQDLRVSTQKRAAFSEGVRGNRRFLPHLSEANGNSRRSGRRKPVCAVGHGAFVGIGEFVGSICLCGDRQRIAPRRGAKKHGGKNPSRAFLCFSV